jgi:hypothetical protein
MVPVTVIGQGETMARITANGIEIAFEAAGPETAPVVLLTRGLGTQMIEWAWSSTASALCATTTGTRA